MNAFDPLETQLRRWKLRPPSPTLKHRLFSPCSTAPEMAIYAKPPFGLSPALACLLVILMMGVFMSALYSRHTVFPRTSPVIMDQEWEEGLAKAIETRLNSGQNVLQIAFFESTNARSWPSSNSSFGLLTTKGLRN